MTATLWRMLLTVFPSMGVIIQTQVSTELNMSLANIRLQILQRPLRWFGGYRAGIVIGGWDVAIYI